MPELESLFNTMGIVSIAMIVLIIALIVAIFDIKSNTRETARQLKEINEKLNTIIPTAYNQPQQTQQYYNQSNGFENNNYYR